MKVLIRKTSLNWVVPWAQRTLFAGAILTLGYCGYALADAWIFQHREQHKLEHSLREGRSPGSLRPPMASSLPPPAMALDGLIGRLEIQRLGVSVVVVEGTDKPTLRRAAGHIVGTALPGELGNVGIAGHRDTFFRPLRNIRRNDLIKITTLRGEYSYRVASTEVVNPHDIAVLNPDGHEILTLVTCYPFYFAGSAPDRFIVRAERVTGSISPLPGDLRSQLR